MRRAIPSAVERVIAERESDAANDDQDRGSAGNYLARQRARNRAKKRAQTLTSVVVSLLVGALWFLSVLVVLSEVGIAVTPLLAGAGVVGIAIGFGAQQVVRDLLAGFFIVLEDQYTVGDWVDLGEAMGEVERVTLRFTRLRDLDGKVWFVPSGEIRRVGNFSKLWSRAVLDVEVAYGTDVEKAGQLMVQAARTVRDAHDSEATVIDEPSLLGVEELGSSGVRLRMLVKTEPGEQWAVARRVRAEVVRRFEAADVTIPYSQVDIHIQSNGPS